MFLTDELPWVVGGPTHKGIADAIDRLDQRGARSYEEFVELRETVKELIADVAPLVKKHDPCEPLLKPRPPCVKGCKRPFGHLGPHGMLDDRDHDECDRWCLRCGMELLAYEEVLCAECYPERKKPDRIGWGDSK
jgi:hypothetical protein